MTASMIMSAAGASALSLFNASSSSGQIDTFDTGGNLYFSLYDLDVQAVPLPAAAWLFGSGLFAGLAALRRRRGIQS